MKRAARPAWSRVLLLVLLVALPAGCLGEGATEGPRLAQPTDAPVSAPVPSPPTPTAIRPDFSDPGYIINGTWRVGDGWDYESNTGRYRQVRVVEERQVGDRRLLLVEERVGHEGKRHDGSQRVWVDATSWLRLNATDQLGVSTAYSPGLPMRYHRNGTFQYNETSVDRVGRVLVNHSVAVNSRLTGRDTILYSWGYVEAARVEHRVVSRAADGNLTRGVLTWWVHRDFQAPVLYDIDDLEGNLVRHKLVAAKVGDMRRGQLASW